MNDTIQVIPNRNDFEGKGKSKGCYVKSNIEIKRLLQGAILGYGIDNLSQLDIDKQKAWSFVFEDNSSALNKDEVRHLINSLELHYIVTNSLDFDYKFN